jgi:hypothetical protein
MVGSIYVRCNIQTRQRGGSIALLVQAKGSEMKLMNTNPGPRHAKAKPHVAVVEADMEIG